MKLRIPDSLTVEYLKEIQIKWLFDLLNELIDTTFNNVVIIAHHPLCCFKRKNKDNRFDTANEEFLMVCHKIYTTCQSMNGANNFYYNSADLHTYQAGDVVISPLTHQSILVHQHIIGTGGAMLEPSLSDATTEEKLINTVNLNYTLKEAVHENGFLVWLIDESNQIQVIFVKATDYYYKYNAKNGGWVQEFNKLTTINPINARSSSKTYRVGKSSKKITKRKKGGKKKQLKYCGGRIGVVDHREIPLDEFNKLRNEANRIMSIIEAHNQYPELQARFRWIMTDDDNDMSLSNNQRASDLHQFIEQYKYYESERITRERMTIIENLMDFVQNNQMDHTYGHLARRLRDIITNENLGDATSDMRMAQILVVFNQIMQLRQQQQQAAENPYI